MEKVARTMLIEGDPISKIAKVTELSGTDIAKIMLSEGFSIPDIAKITSLSETEIMKLKSEIDKENPR